MPKINYTCHEYAHTRKRRGKGVKSERMRKSNSHVLNLLGLLVVAAHTLAHTDTLTHIKSYTLCTHPHTF